MIGTKRKGIQFSRKGLILRKAGFTKKRLYLNKEVRNKNNTQKNIP